MLRYSVGRVGIGDPLGKEIPELTLLSRLIQMDKVQVRDCLKTRWRLQIAATTTQSRPASAGF
jgi:hypothetical protein